MPGQKIGRFEIPNELGKSAQGAVYLAQILQQDMSFVRATILIRDNK